MVKSAGRRMMYMYVYVYVYIYMYIFPGACYIYICICHDIHDTHTHACIGGGGMECIIYMFLI